MRETPLVEDGKTVAIVGSLTDITERRRAEAEHEKLQSQLAQARKMESVGRLAGGVAHDYNNIVMGILNYAELCRDGIEADHPIRQWLDEITNEAQRSANLTRQLLAFARKQTIAPQVVDLNDVVGQMLKMLRPYGTPTHDSGSMWVATPFTVRDFHSLFVAGFNRRLPSNF